MTYYDVKFEVFEDGKSVVEIESQLVEVDLLLLQPTASISTQYKPTSLSFDRVSQDTRVDVLEVQPPRHGALFCVSD